MRIGLILLILLLCPVLALLHAADPAGETAFFETEIRPLLLTKCLGCHGETKAKGNLKLTGRAEMLRGGDLGPVIVPGKVDESLLLKVVRYQDDLRMPPRGKLAEKEIHAIEKWLKLGAPWPGGQVSAATPEKTLVITDKQRQFWSFQPIQSPRSPEVRDPAWSQSPIDRFILNKLEAKGISPTPLADRLTLIRRITFDLIGLPPTPAEIDAFLADHSPQAIARVVDRLLASPQYGERWGRHWLDVVRYADARDLIQLPPESDFREAWRFRDWVVDAFNRDLPYNQLVQMQVAGDILPAAHPGEFNRDGLIATGFLALADFVPGDVDKNQMIADYVNDQIDVVSRAFLGLSIACARCHDHKFDPISTEDYYALGGIFFSTRIIPGPVAGNTPLIRVPLASPAEIAQQKSRSDADAKRRAELEQLVKDSADSAYRAHLSNVLTGQSRTYLLAACRCRGIPRPDLVTIAKMNGIDSGMLAEWVHLLDRIAKQPLPEYPTPLIEAATGKLFGPSLEKYAETFQQTVADRARKLASNSPVSIEKQDLNHSALFHFSAADPRIHVDSSNKVNLWPNCAGTSGDATPVSPGAPVRTTAKIGDQLKPVLRFDGKSVLEAPGSVPPVGTFFVVHQTANSARNGERLVGWEDSAVGAHGLGIMTGPNGSLSAILRNNSKTGDLVDTHKISGFETVCITWGPEGTALYRNNHEQKNPDIKSVSSDPMIPSLKIGGPGSGGSLPFTGDIAELRVYSRPLIDLERKQVETELRAAWFEPSDPKRPIQLPRSDLLADFFTPRGPFWPAKIEREKRLPAEVRLRLQSQHAELEAIRNQKWVTFPVAVVAQEGGPPGTRHEGFKDSPVFLRGDHKHLGKPVPRGFPRILTSGSSVPIISGSGRLQLAAWLTRPENPLTARVMVNRIWQHHFGEGLVRTPNDFGERGDRPTHPELLDFLASRFIESGWSIKAVHRLILLSATYQQGSKANTTTVAADPENRLFSRFQRQRLDAEAIRDSLLAVSERLDLTVGGPSFTDLAKPRRTLYLMAARTGANTSEFGRLFDRADPSLLVAQRGESVVAPQALFWMNDPFVTNSARALAARILKETSDSAEARIRYLYRLVFGRLPTRLEYEIGTQFLADKTANSLERYCLLLLCTNEFLYLD